MCVRTCVRFCGYMWHLRWLTCSNMCVLSHNLLRARMRRRAARLSCGAHAAPARIGVMVCIPHDHHTLTTTSITHPNRCTRGFLSWVRVRVGRPIVDGKLHQLSVRSVGQTPTPAFMGGDGMGVGGVSLVNGPPHLLSWLSGCCGCAGSRRANRPCHSAHLRSWVCAQIPLQMACRPTSNPSISRGHSLAARAMFLRRTRATVS